jgi:hypothetical protein
MSIRSLFSLLILLISVFLIIKLDLFTVVKVGVTNMIYGNEMAEMKDIRVAVEPLLADLEKEGLTRETIRRELATVMERVGVRNLPEEEWRNMPDRPTLNVIVNASKVVNHRYQYSVVIEVTKQEPLDPAGYSAKQKTLWSSSGMGEGDVADIRARIVQEMGIFLKARGK